MTDTDKAAKLVEEWRRLGERCGALHIYDEDIAGSPTINDIVRRISALLAAERAAEREACARIVETTVTGDPTATVLRSRDAEVVKREIAAAIRARGEEK